MPTKIVFNNGTTLKVSLNPKGLNALMMQGMKLNSPVYLEEGHKQIYINPINVAYFRAEYE